MYIPHRKVYIIILTYRDAYSVGQLVTWIAKGSVIRWVNDNGDIETGIIRHYVKSADDFGFIDPMSDIRNAYVRITKISNGFDTAIKVSDMIMLINDFRMVED